MGAVHWAAFGILVFSAFSLSGRGSATGAAEEWECDTGNDDDNDLDQSFDRRTVDVKRGRIAIGDGPLVSLSSGNSVLCVG